MPKTSTIQIGGFGLKHHSGRISEEFQRNLQGQRGIKIYREMADNDPIVAGYLFAIESLIKSAGHSVKPANQDDAAIEWADFVTSCITDVSPDWSSFMSEILSELVFGWSYFEIVYKTRRGKKKNALESSAYNDGKIGWALLGLRAQESLDRWEISDSGEILGMWQQLERGAPVFIPIEKSILFRTRVHKNNPEGRSLLRGAYRSWYFKKRLEEVEAIGVERNIAGLPVLQVPPRIMDPNASASDLAIRADLEKLVQEVRMDERMGLLIPAEMDETNMPTGYKFGLLASSGKSEAGTDPIIRRWDSRIAVSVLADFMIVALDKVGSFAALKGKANIFGIALTTILDQIFYTLNRALAELLDLNDCPTELRPTLEHGDVSQAELADVSAYLSALGTAGFVTPTKDLENELLRRGSLPFTEEGQLSRGSEDGEIEDEQTDLEPGQTDPELTESKRSGPKGGKT